MVSWLDRLEGLTAIRLRLTGLPHWLDAAKLRNLNSQLYPQTGSPLEKGRAKGGGLMRRSRGTSDLNSAFGESCFAGPASARRIHPPALGLPPFGLKGKRFYGQAKRLLYFRPNLDILCRMSISKEALAYRYSRQVRLPIIMQALGEGPLQRRRMDAAQPLDLNSHTSTLNSFLKNNILIKIKQILLLFLHA